jgi:hypothetical protein
VVCRFEDPFELVQILFHAVLEQLGCELAEMGGWSEETGAADAAVEGERRASWLGSTR